MCMVARGRCVYVFCVLRLMTAMWMASCPDIVLILAEKRCSPVLMYACCTYA